MFSSAKPLARRPALLAGVLILGCTLWGPSPSEGRLPDLELTQIVDGLDNATSIAQAGDERLFVGLRDGRIVIVADGAVAPVPFLDIRDRVRFENGLDGFYSFAFHPQPASDFVFALYVNRDLETVVSRFVISKDPNFVDPSTEVVLLTIDQSVGQHDGNHLAFGPEEYLYISTGESGPGFDPLCLAQNPVSLQGKMLRIDVDQGAGQAPFYSTPADNPFVSTEGFAPEIWALGLRNPWRFSFDRASGDLWIADVGEDSREEINRQAASSMGGENYGWKTFEGTLCLENTAGCDPVPPPCESDVYTSPVMEYDTGENCSVIGGFVYRGSEIPGLDGTYIHGDFCSGILWAGVESGGSWTQVDTELRAPRVTAFGEDPEGELYVLTGSALYRIDPAEGAGGCVADESILCLNNDRFQVRAEWRIQGGDRTAAPGSELTDDGGFFWFFDPENPELFVKVLDACAPPFERYWVFIAGLTDVETHIEVIDSQTGEARIYDKSLGIPFESIYDTSAFDSCP